MAAKVQPAVLKTLGAILARTERTPVEVSVTVEEGVGAVATVEVTAATLRSDERRHMRPWVDVTGKVVAVMADMACGRPVLGYDVAGVDMETMSRPCRFFADFTDGDLASLVSAGVFSMGSRVDLTALAGARLEVPCRTDITEVARGDEASVVFVDDVVVEDGWAVDGLGGLVTVKAPKPASAAV